jgi:hypothetical protein
MIVYSFVHGRRRFDWLIKHALLSFSMWGLDFFRCTLNPINFFVVSWEYKIEGELKLDFYYDFLV